MSALSSDGITNPPAPPPSPPPKSLGGVKISVRNKGFLLVGKGEKEAKHLSLLKLVKGNPFNINKEGEKREVESDRQTDRQTDGRTADRDRQTHRQTDREK